MNDKRQATRFRPDDYVFVHNRTPAFFTLGTVKDIGERGLGLIYLPELERDYTESTDVDPGKLGQIAVDILWDYLHIPHILCKVAYHQIQPRHLASYLVTCRCGLVFEDLTQEQRTKLECLLHRISDNCAVHRDALSA